MRKPEEFAAMYALVKDNSEGTVAENKRKAEQAQCTEVSSENQSRKNVISDREAGRMSTENENWGYHQDNRKREREQNRLRSQTDESTNQDVENRSNDESRSNDRRNVVHRTKVVEEGNEICFTTRPVPTCREGTVPKEKKQKKLQLHCQPRNEESVMLKRRVEQGANPDLTRKPATKSHVFLVPSVCIAMEQ